MELGVQQHLQHLKFPILMLGDHFLICPPNPAIAQQFSQVFPNHIISLAVCVSERFIPKNKNKKKPHAEVIHEYFKKHMT